MERYRGRKNLVRTTFLLLLFTASLSAQSFDSPGATLKPASTYHFPADQSSAYQSPGYQSPAHQNNEHVFNKKLFWLEVGAYTVANVLDGYTTVAHPEGYEEAGFPQGSAFLLGKHPSAGRYVVTMGAVQVATSFAAYRLEHSQKRYLRIIGHALMVQGIYSHTDGYINNVLLVNGNAIKR